MNYANHGTWSATRYHCVSSRAKQIKRSPHADIDRAIKAFHVRFVEQFSIAESSIGYGDIQPAKAIDGVLDHLLNRALASDIKHGWHGFTTQRLNLGDRVLGRQDIVNDYSCSSLRQTNGHCGSDTRAPPVTMATWSFSGSGEPGFMGGS